MAEKLVCEQRTQGETGRELESQDEFLAFAAHKLRTPFNAVTVRARLTSAGVNAKAQERIIADLYDAASILGGKFPMTFNLPNLSKLLAEEVETVFKRRKFVKKK